MLGAQNVVQLSKDKITPRSQSDLRLFPLQEHVALFAYNEIKINASFIVS